MLKSCPNRVILNVLALIQVNKHFIHNAEEKGNKKSEDKYEGSN